MLSINKIIPIFTYRQPSYAGLKTFSSPIIKNKRNQRIYQYCGGGQLISKNNNV